MQWETAVAIALAPIAADLIRRHRQKKWPFDGSLFAIFRGDNRDGSDAGAGEHGGDSLPRLAAPLAHQQSSEERAVQSLLDRAATKQRREGDR